MMIVLCFFIFCGNQPILADLQLSLHINVVLENIFIYILLKFTHPEYKSQHEMKIHPSPFIFFLMKMS